MWDLSLPHILAIAATFLAALATLSQARHAMRKAEVERKKPGAKDATGAKRAELALDGGGRLVKPKHWMWAIWEALFNRNKRDDAVFDVRHARNVATLWLVIWIGSLFAFAAEVVDAAPL
jgi:hypothetical protein